MKRGSRFGARRPKRRRVRLVTGGYRFSRDTQTDSSGSMKAQRRVARKAEKAKKKNRG